MPIPFAALLFSHINISAQEYLEDITEEDFTKSLLKKSGISSSHF
jgi:hypothetical protein